MAVKLRIVSYLFLLLVNIVAVRLSAQAPGYMGKRFTACYGYNFSPAFVGGNYNDRYWNQLHEFSLQYAFSDNWQAGLSTRLFNALQKNTEAISKEGTPENYFVVKGNSMILNFRHFKTRYVAPWGRYFDMGLVINNTKTSYDAYMYIRQTWNGHDTLVSSFGPAEQRFITPDIMVGWGRTRVLKDCISIDWGWNSCLGALFGGISDTFKSLTMIYTMDNYIEETYRRRLHGLNRFNLYLRVGYLF